MYWTPHRHDALSRKLSYNNALDAPDVKAAVQAIARHMAQARLREIEKLERQAEDLVAMGYELHELTWVQYTDPQRPDEIVPISVLHE